MQPHISFTRTVDGVAIAYATIGSGLPLVHMRPYPWRHLQLEWNLPDVRWWYERLSRGRRLITFDPRGTGLSQCLLTSLSLDDLVRDLEAVVDALGLERFALSGVINTAAVAVAYAARHPERVSHLIVSGFAPRLADGMPKDTIRAVFGIRAVDWEVYTETMAHLMLGWTEGEIAHQFAGFMRSTVTPDVDRLYTELTLQIDVTEIVPSVHASTLVLDRAANWLRREGGRAAATALPTAQLVFIEGTSRPTIGPAEPMARAIDAFLGDVAPDAPALAVAPGALRTILFTDVEGSTSLTTRLGDAQARAVLREHERVVRDALQAHGGEEVKTLGDGFMASFGSARQALACAAAIQRDVANGGDATAVRVRIGLNAGEPIAEDADLFGTAVIIASRLADAASGGEILVANVVRELAAGKGFLFADRGEVTLHGLAEPVHVYALEWRS